MIIEVSRNPETDTESLRVAGPMTLATVFEFQDSLRATTGPKTLIDLSGVPYMDSAGLGAVLSFHVSCSRHERAYAIIGVAQRLRIMMEAAKVDTILHIFASAEEAGDYLEL
ncbi:MAG: hypothetical protein JWO80_6255 [Bryobacterales bacterium]|nr:hypothetical protein [Bryobacterales bacterium]